jgi:hypothetical protein
MNNAMQARSYFCIFTQIVSTNIMLQTFLAGCDEIPAYAGMTASIYFGKKRRGKQDPCEILMQFHAAPLFLFKPKVTSFQLKLESAKLSKMG